MFNPQLETFLCVADAHKDLRCYQRSGLRRLRQTDLSRAGTVVMQYTGHSDYTPNDPPTFACVGENNGIADPQTMRRRIDHLRALGINTEFHVYPGLSYGFGLGMGTVAEGWINDAVSFCEAHM